MPAEMRFSQGENVGGWSRALSVAPGEAVTIEGRSEGHTEIRSWVIWCHFAHNGGGIAPTPGVPARLAYGTDSSPTYEFTPAGVGLYTIELRTFSTDDFSGTATSDFRELMVRTDELGCGAPVVELTAGVVASIAEQVADGRGWHTNYSAGSVPERGVVGPPGAAEQQVAIDAMLHQLVGILGRLTTLEGAVLSGVNDLVSLVGPPTILSATISAATPNVIDVTTSENVTGFDDTGFAVSGRDIEGVTGADDEWAIELDSPAIPGQVVTVSWDATNTVVDAAGHALVAGSVVATNSAEYPTITGAAIDGTALTVTYSEACNSTAVGLSLEVDGVAATLTVASGSGTVAVVYTSSVAAVAADVVTMDVAATNGVATLLGLALQADADVAVTNSTEA